MEARSTPNTCAATRQISRILLRNTPILSIIYYGKNARDFIKAQNEKTNYPDIDLAGLNSNS
jgi:hypothetical protein